jgi:uncharacterized membrane protein
MSSELVLVLAFGIGVIAGLRALTAPTVVAWAAHVRGYNLQGSHLGFMASTPAVIIFTILALGEIVNDKLPKTPSRTAPPSIAVRMVTGALAAATLSAAAAGSIGIGALCGAVGALAGTFGGYYARTGAVRALGVPDFVIALVEDAIAVGGGLFLATRL